MTSVAEKTRKITVGGTRFGWRVTHRHRSPTPGDGQRCLHEFLAYRIGTSRAPFRLSFLQGPSGDAGYIQGADYTLDHGGLWLSASSTKINLHRPATAAALIQQALDLGWTDAAPLILSDGFAFVHALPQHVREQIAGTGPAPPPG